MKQNNGVLYGAIIGGVVLVAALVLLLSGKGRVEELVQSKPAPNAKTAVVENAKVATKASSDAVSVVKTTTDDQPTSATQNVEAMAAAKVEGFPPDPVISGPKFMVTGRLLSPTGEGIGGALLNENNYMGRMMGSEGDGEDVYESRSLSDGRFRFVAPARIFNVVNASAEGFASASKTFEQTNQQMGQHTVYEYELDWVLKAASSLEVAVADETGNPVPDTVVELILLPEKANQDFAMGLDAKVEIPSKLIEQKSDSTGKVTFTSLDSSREYLLQGNRSGYRSSSTKVTANTSSATLTMKSGGGEVGGIVVNSKDLSPIVGAQVRLIVSDSKEDGQFPMSAESKTETDSGGRFRFKNQNAGPYILTVRHEDYSPYFNAEYKSPLGEEEIRTDLEIALNKGYSIKGQILELATGKPIPGVRVEPFRQFYEALLSRDKFPTSVTDAEGRYKLEGVPDAIGGMVMMQVSLEGWALIRDGQDNFSFPGGSNMFMMRVSGEETTIEHNLVMSKEVTISGRVVDLNKQPIMGATVRYSEQGSHRYPNQSLNESKGEITNAQGQYRITVSPQSNGILSAVVDEIEVPGPSVTVGSEPLTNQEIVVGDFISITGTVLDPFEKPIADAEVSLHQLIETTPSSFQHTNLQKATTDASGTFTFQRLYPMRTVFTATHAKYAASKQLEQQYIPGAQVEPVILSLREGKLFAGNLYQADGRTPAVGAIYNIHSSDGTYSSMTSSTTDENGRFFVENVPVEIVNINFWGKDGMSKDFENLEAGKTDHVLLLDTLDQIAVLITAKDAETDELILDFRARDYWGGPSRVSSQGVLLMEKVGVNSQYEMIFDATGYSTTTMNFVVMLEPDDDDEVMELTVELEKGISVTGTVLDEITGMPVAGVRVDYYEGDPEPWAFGQIKGKRLVTDSEGRFTLADAKVGQGTFHAEAKTPYSPLIVTRVLRKTEPEIEPIQLNSGVLLAVTILNPDQKPVPGYPVVCTYIDRKSKSGVTNAQGVVEFPNLPLEAVNLNFPQNGLTIGTKEFTTAGREEMSFTLGKADLEISLVGGLPDESYNIHVSMIDGIRAYYGYQSTGDKNKFIYKQIPAGTWKVDVYPVSWGQVITSANITIDASDTGLIQKEISLPSGKLVGTLLKADGTAFKQNDNIKGSVKWRWLDAPSDALLKESSVVIKPGGTFEVVNLSPGTYEVIAWVEGVGRGMTEQVITANSAEVSCTIRLKTSGGTLISHAFKLETGDPLQSAWVTLVNTKTQESFHEDRRQADGTLTIPYLEPGTYKMSVSAWSHNEVSREVTIEEGKNAEFEDVLYGCGAIRWKLYTKDGKSATGIKCRIIPLDQGSLESKREGETENPSGEYVVRGLRPGNYQAEALSQEGSVIASLKFNLIEGQLITEKAEIP
jgi:5-hydroxyisourate hydrolase-like protein (transthyretin family)